MAANDIQPTWMLLLQLRQEAAQAAMDKLATTLQSISDAEEECGGNIPELKMACRLLQAETQPWARGAADAQSAVDFVLQRWPLNAEKAVKQLKNANADTRNIVVLRCLAYCGNPTVRAQFISKCSEAYDVNDLHPHLRASVLLAYQRTGQ